MRSPVLGLVLAVALASVGLPARAGVAEPVPLLVRSTDTGWAEFSSGSVPVPEEADGIGPGSQIRISFPDGSGSGCTANYLWRDAAGALYLGSAGHCFLPDDVAGTHGSGADYDPSGVVVEARYQDCGPNVCGQDWITLGEVVYARQGRVGDDFGLVRIPDAVKPRLRVTMPTWGGPVREGSVSAGDELTHYGHGLGYGLVYLTRNRTGLGVTSSTESFSAQGFAIFGDSGSALNAGSPRVDAPVNGDEAAGIITHGIPGTTIFYGTTVARARAMASQAGLSVSVVVHGESL